jgi:ketosteroid isomerase-like protein
MKKFVTSVLFSAAFLLSAVEMNAQAQSKPAATSRYTDRVGENPTADADIQVVTNYLNFLIAGDTDKAKMLAADTYKSYGPAAADSATRDETMTVWQRNAKTQSNRKMHLEGQTTFRVKTGRLQGNWVSTWAEYTFTQNGKTVKVPFQYIAHITKGKIDFDRSYSDQLSPSQALGYKLTPPETTK